MKNKLIKQITRNKENIELVVLIQDEEDMELTCYGNNGTLIDYKSKRYEIGSITKLFTASLLLHLNQKYQLDRDENLMINQQVVPSLNQLATHTSGLRGQPLSKMQTLAMFASVLTNGKACIKNPYRNFTTEEFLESIVELPKPGSFHYSNANYALIGIICETLEKQEFHSIMSDYIQNILRLKSTSFDRENLILGYTKNKSVVGNWIWERGDIVAASGGLYSNPYDLLTYLNIQMENQSMLSPIKKISKYFDMGFGWKIRNKEVYWHNGGTGCFSSFVGFHSITKKRVVILSNYRSLKVDELGFYILETNVGDS